jgi:hypothetical protein
VSAVSPEAIQIVRAAIEAAGAPVPAGWEPIDLSALLAGQYVPPTPQLGRRSDGLALLYPEKVHSLAGESEAGKSWLALLWAQEQLLAGNDVVFVDFEDDAASVVGRLQVLGLPPDIIQDHFRYVRPEQSHPAAAVDMLLSNVDNCRLVVMDGVTEMMNLHGLKPTDDVDVAEMWKLPREIAARGPAVLLLDHVVKDRQSRGRWATGSQHKLSGITGAAFLLETATPFAMGQTGHSNLLVAKDRPGAIRGSAVKIGQDRFAIAQLHIASEDGRVAFSLLPYTATTKSLFRPTVKMQQISDVLADAGKPTSYNQIKSSVGGKSEYVRTAVDSLIAQGYVNVIEGIGSSHLHTLIKPYTAQ